VAEVQASRLRRLHRLIGDLATLAKDEVLDAAALRSRLRDLIAPFETERRSTRVAEIRRELGHKSQELARLLKTVRAAELAMPADHAVAAALVTLDSLAASGAVLPAATPQPFGPSWQNLKPYLQRLEAGLTAGLAALAEAVAAGTIAVEDSELRLPRRKPAPPDPRVDPARQALAVAVGNAQLPEVIIEVDHLTRFSWTLLGRPARSERELVTLYAGLIGVGSDLAAAELVRMVPALAADSLGQMVLRIEADGRLRAANDTVLRFMRGHRIADLWGRACSPQPT